MGEGPTGHHPIYEHGEVRARTMTVDTLISGGRIVTESSVRKADVAIDDGSIVAVGTPASMPEAEETVDALGLLVMPGFVDPHVHIDDYSSVDTYETASAAAAIGGITTVVDFAWQRADNHPDSPPRPLLAGIEAKREKAAGSYVDHSLHGALTIESEDVLAEIPAAAEAGVTSFKMFTAYDLAVSNGFIERALEVIADEDCVGVFHTEDNAVCEARIERYRDGGKSDSMWFPRSRPDYAEAMAADDVLRLARATGAKYYGLHTSSRAAAEVIDHFRRDGSQIRAETCTHYTTLDDSVYVEQGNLPLIAPPIRTPDDIEAMFEYLGTGSLGVVSTDHAPRYAEEKRVDWWDSPFGAGSLQTSVPVFHDEAIVRRGFSYPFLVRTMSATPARTFGMQEKGTLEPGTDADIVLFDPEETYEIAADDNASNSDFSIYEGREVTGRVKKTFVRGTLVADDGEIVAESGYGQSLERERPDWST